MPWEGRDDWQHFLETGQHHQEGPCDHNPAMVMVEGEEEVGQEGGASHWYCDNKEMIDIKPEDKVATNIVKSYCKQKKVKLGNNYFQGTHKIAQMCNHESLFKEDNNFSKLGHNKRQSELS